MSTYRCRFVKPSPGDWSDVKGSSPGDAAMNLHSEHPTRGYFYRKSLPNLARETVRFALIEVDGHGELVTRMFGTGIWRKGNPNLASNPSLSDIARELGWTHDVQELIADGWDLEEQYPTL